MKHLLLLLCISSLFLSAVGCPPSTETPDNQNTNDPPPSGSPVVGFTDPQVVSATVKLPSGVNVDVSKLKVATNVDDAAVGADGATFPQVINDFPNLVLLVDEDGKTLLMSFLSPQLTDQEISSRSTATALLFFALGGWTLPPENLQDVLDRIASSSSMDSLVSAIEQGMAANPTIVTDGDSVIREAIKEGAKELIADETAGAGSRLLLADAKERLASQFASSSFQMLVSPEATEAQSGVQVLQNPNGDGVIAQNNFRRRGLMYAYLVGTKNEAGVLTEVDPPEQVGDPIEIPSTYSLGLVSSFKQAAENIFNLTGTAVAPWAPIQTGAKVLPREGEATQTLYKVVVLGPALDFYGPYGPLDDPMFANFHDEWQDQIDSMIMQTILEDFVFRALEFLAIAGPAQINKAGAASAVAEFRRTLDPRILAHGLAIPIRTKVDVRKFVLFVLSQASNSGELAMRQEVVKFTQAMWGASAANKVKLERLESNLARASSIASIITAVDATMAALDLGAVLHDLGSSRTADVWDATVVPRTVRINPSTTTMTRTRLTASFKATMQETASTELLFRWKGSSSHGHLNDYLSDAVDQFDTGHNNSAFYAVDDADNVVDGVMDTVTVEAYQDDGSGVISSSTPFIGKATAIISGQINDCPELDEFQTIPSPELGSISMPEEVYSGETLDITLTINPDAYRSYNNGADRNVSVRVFISGAMGVASGVDQQRILLDGAPIVDFVSGNIYPVGSEPRYFDTDPPVGQYSCMGIDSNAGLINFHTGNGPISHVLSVPLDSGLDEVDPCYRDFNMYRVFMVWAEFTPAQGAPLGSTSAYERFVPKARE